MSNKTISFIDLITEDQYIIILQTCSVVWTTLSVVGIGSNIINIRTFIAMGLADGVTVSFLALAIADLAYLVMSVCLGVAMICFVIESEYLIRFSIEPLSLCIYFFNLTVLINISNTLMTTFLAVARCMCVAKPLQFKNIFTRKRAIIFNVGVALFSTFSYTPVLANMAILQKFDSKINISRPTLWTSPERESMKVIVWSMVHMILPFTTQIIVIVCIVVMAKCLREAARFRLGSTTTLTPHNMISIHSKYTQNKIDVPFSKSIRAYETLKSKELRVVQQVILISLVYIICNIPKMLISVATSIEPDFTIGKRYHKIYIGVNSLEKQFEAFNSAINLAIYYKYNTKFRSVMGFWSKKQ